MNKFTAKIVLVVVLAFCTVFYAYSDGPLDELQKGVAELSGTLAKSLPFNSAIGLNWSDAYIGKFLPSLPPHFGAGASLGFTTLDMPGLESVAGIFDYEIPGAAFLSDGLLANKMMLPAYTAEARLGGFFLPFDIGAKFGMLPKGNWFGAAINMDYQLMGADFRLAVLDGKTSLILPNISIGVGVNRLTGGIGATVGGDTTLSFTDALSNPHNLVIASPEVNLVWETTSVEGKIQISKQILLFTPYVGAAGGYSWSKAGYNVKTQARLDGALISDTEIDTINDYLEAQGLDKIDVTQDGLSSIVANNAWNARIFGGVSLNIVILHIDFSAMYNIFDQQLGAQLSARVQL